MFALDVEMLYLYQRGFSEHVAARLACSCYSVTPLPLISELLFRASVCHRYAVGTCETDKASLPAGGCGRSIR